MRWKTQVTTLASLAVLGAWTMGGCGDVIDKQAEAIFFDALGNTTITVFPVYIRENQNTRYDAAAAEKFATFCADNRLGIPTLANTEIPITSTWGANQAKMFRGSVEDFAKYLAANPIATEYALLAEYLIGGAGRPIGVHIYLLDAAGKPVYGSLLNSHHPGFNAVNPKSADDCTTIVLNTLRENLIEKRTERAAQATTKIRRDSSLTVFPVRLVDKPATNVGQALGLILEQQQGMTDIQPATATYDRPAGATFDEAAKGFGEFIQQNPIETDYALYAEVDGTRNPPQVLEVRAVLADKTGAILWSDRQTPADPDFKRLHVNEPMLCCALVAERLRSRIEKSAATTKPKGEGRMARLWREKSGTPEDKTFTEMKTAQGVFREKHAAAKLLVYAAQVHPEIDRPAAAHIADLLNADDFCTAEVAAAEPRFEIAPSSNEQKRLWDLAKAFRDYIQAEKPDADYLLLAEYTVRPNDQKVWSVHTVVCDRAGAWVIVDFQNDHQPDFQRINPQTRDDCGKLVLERVKSYAR